MKALSLALAAFLALTMFTGCEIPELNLGNSTTTETAAGVEETNDGNKEAEAVSTATPEAGNENVELEVKEIAKFPSKLSATKIGTVDKDYLIDGEGGLYYSEADKHGIISFDGKQDTGAIYAYCMPLGQYFQVVTEIPGDENDINSMNCVGLVDVSGKVIIPEEYASINLLNDRYVKVCKVTEETDSRDDALVYRTNDGTISFMPDDDDIFYKGVWYVYDLVTGKKMENVTGTNSDYVLAYGNYIQYVSDDGVEHAVNADGQELPAGAELFDNGCYKLLHNSGGTVYDSNDNELFTYKDDGFVPYYAKGDYIFASKSVNGETKDVLINMKGKIATAEFNATPRVYGDLLFVEDTLYDFQGNKIIDGNYLTVHYEERLGSSWMLETENGECTIVTGDGKVLYKGVEDDNLYIDYLDFVVSDEIDDKKVCYSYKDSDFTIEGFAIAPFLVMVYKSNSICDLVDAISGETILQGYKEYLYADGSDSGFYIYAEKVDGGIDIYTIQ